MKKYGKGIATIIYPIGASASPNPSGIHLEITRDAKAVIRSGSCEIGQGSNTALSQIAAEALGVDFPDVKFLSSQTKDTPYDHGAGASRQTYIAGSAIKKACKEAKKILIDHSAKFLEKEPDEIDIAEGHIIDAKSHQRLYPLNWVTEAIYTYDEFPKPIVDSVFDPQVTALDPINGHGVPYSMYAFATNIVELTVDDETGIVTLLNVVAVHDIGILVNPLLTEGQVIGGVCTGIGYALYEEILVNEKGILNPGFVDYVLPTVLDMPPVKVKFIDSKSPEGFKLNSKGIGEPATVPAAPAIANAIFNAVGVRCYELPITPQKILTGLNVIQGQDSKYESSCIR